MSNNASNVGIGKPMTNGAIYVAEYGTALPTDGSGELDAAFECLGYVSEDGVTETTETETEDIKAWGGDIVARPQTSYAKTFSFSCLEINEAVLKLAWGADNVTTGENGSIAVRHNSDTHPYVAIVIEYLLSDTLIKRTVVERGRVTEIGEISYTDSDAVKHEITVGALPGSDNDVSKDYYAEVA